MPSTISRLALAAVLTACGGAATAPPAADVSPAPADAVTASRPPISATLTRRGVPLADGARVPFGEPVAVTVRGAAPRERVVVKVALAQRTAHFTSWARFEADDGGLVDTGVSPALDGTYTGADVDGLFWSSVPSPTPQGELARNEVRFVVETEGRSASTLRLGRAFGDTAARIPIDAPDLVGALYVPEGPRRRGVIVAFGGSEGGSYGGEAYAAYWAERGYAALGVAYFGEGSLPPRLERVPLESFAKAIAWVEGRPEVDASRVVVMGGSRGGEAALALAAALPRIGGTVAFVPSGASWGAPTRAGGEIASWTHEGRDLAFVPSARGAPTVTVTPSGERVEHHTPVFAASLDAAGPAGVEAAAFRVERAAGPILVLAGADDQLWPSCRLAEIAMARLRASGHQTTHGDEAICFGDAGHAFGFPGVSTLDAATSPDPWGGSTLLALGGTPRGTAAASRAADDKVRALLERVFR